MLADLEILVLVLLIAAVVGIVREARGRLVATGLLKFLWRWHTGQSWHGKPLTDAGWFRPASDRKAFTPTGHAPRFHHYSIWRRTVSRTGRSLFLVLLILLWINYPRIAPWITILAVIAAIGFWCWRAWLRWNGRKHRRTWIEPLHLVAAPLVGIPRALPASSWLEIADDRSRVRAALPPGYNPDSKEKERVVSTFATKLGLEQPDPHWHLTGPEPYFELTAAVPPPARVGLIAMRAALDSAKPDDLIWGPGRRSTVVSTSLSGDSPHVGLSMGSGAGKSETVKWLVVQQLHHGAIALILDYKMISHMWAQGLPNVVIARRPHEIHAALLWLWRELERRNEVALAGADIHGRVHAVVGPRLIVVGEELNATVSRLRAHWRQVRDKDDPVRSPALEALDAASFMGRQVMVNLVYVGQRLSVRASGGDGDARENIGVIAFSRYSASNWKMLAPDFSMPPKSLTPGRIQVVSDKVQEAQVPLLTTIEAREMATSGVVSPLPYGMPGAPRVTGTETTLIPGSDLGDVLAQDADAPPPVTSAAPYVTLSEAAREGIVSCSLAALRIARHRGQLPDAKGQRGLAQEFDPLELAEWDAARR
jgi:hypothetical protein